MTEEVWPQSGEKLNKTDFRRSLKGVSGAQDYVVSGFTVAAGTGLNVDIAAGSAHVDATYIARDATKTLAVAASQVALKIWVGYHSTTRDTLVWATGANPGSNYILLAEVDTDGSGVTAVRDKRNTNPIGGWRDP